MGNDRTVKAHSHTMTQAAYKPMSSNCKQMLHLMSDQFKMIQIAGSLGNMVQKYFGYN